MSVLRVLVMAVLLSALAGCNADDGAAGSGAPGGFRNLGKRGDSNLSREAPAVSLR